jgi:hypothetical protein
MRPDKQQFHELQSLVCDLLPYYAAALTVAAGYPAKLSRLQNVKAGKIISLADLVALVRHSLPDFEIPAHLLPEVAGQEAIAS